MKRALILASVLTGVGAARLAAGPAGKHCDPGDVHFVELENALTRYAVSDYGWSHSWLIPKERTYANDRFSGDNAVALRYSGINRAGWLTHCLDREDDFIGDRGHPTDAGTTDPDVDAPWEVVTPVFRVNNKKTRCRSQIQNVLNNLIVDIETTINTNGLTVRQTFTVRNPASNTTTFTNVDLIDYMHAHTNGTLNPHGSVIVHPSLFTKVEYDPAADSIVFTDRYEDTGYRPRLVMTGTADSTKHDCGFVRLAAQPHPIWKLVEMGDLQNRNSAAFGDVGGALQWRLTNSLAPGASASMTVIKYVPNVTIRAQWAGEDQATGCCRFNWVVYNHTNAPITEFYVDWEAGTGGQVCTNIDRIEAPTGWTAAFCYPWDQSAPTSWAVVKFTGGTLAARTGAVGTITIDVNGDTDVNVPDEFFPGWGAFSVPAHGIHMHVTDSKPSDFAADCSLSEFGPHIKEQAFWWSPGTDVTCKGCLDPTEIRRYTPNLAIPDSDATGVSDTQNVTTNGPVRGLEVGLHIPHTRQGDIIVKLKHNPSNTEVVILDRPGHPQVNFGFSADNYGNLSAPADVQHFVLTDSVADIYDEPVVAFPGMPDVTDFWKPHNPLSAFDGLDRRGPWRLTVIDAAALDTGTFSEWSLRLPKAGACCFQNGTCLERTECECETQLGGQYQGDGTFCADGWCAGACCLDEFCIESTAVECLDVVGDFIPFEECDPNPCLFSGACCRPDGSCDDNVYEADCATNGVFQGAGTECEFVYCPPRGACCLIDGSCLDGRSYDECLNSNGTYQGDLTLCSSAVCPNVGACCFPWNGDCLDAVAEDLCMFIGGDYAGDASTCGVNTCPQPPVGRCCLPDGSCEQTSLFECQGRDGQYYGDGTSCDGSCPVYPTGACCIPQSFEGALSFYCLEITGLGCLSVGGDYYGDGTTCAATDCNPVGACCLFGSCFIDTEEVCYFVGGDYYGDDSSCYPGLCPSCPAEGILFVDRDAVGVDDGSSWTHAFKDLQDALAFSAYAGPGAVCEIWVAEGIYRPAAAGGSQSAAFQLPDGLAIYGGFAGFETALNQRDPAANMTILSGDLNGDDGPGFANRGDNAFHVVTASGVDPTTRLDGFVITGGNAHGTAPDDVGGGMVSSGGSPTVDNCTFVANSAFYGGGGYYATGGSHPVVVRCQFSQNRSTSPCDNCGGGGFHAAVGSNAQLINCRFEGNTALDFGQGGGAFFRENSHGGLVNCAFASNTAEVGGAVCLSTSNVTFTHCTMFGNTGTLFGGAFFIFQSDPVVANSILWGDTSPTGPELALYACPSAISIDYSDVQGGAAAAYIAGGGCSVNWGPGSIDADPLLDAGGRLNQGSPCIEAGNNGALPSDAADLDGDGDVGEPTPLDLEGLARLQGAAVDMGAFESPYFPDCNSNGTADALDISGGTSADANGNTTPDECEGGPPATVGQVVSRRANPSAPGANCDAADSTGPFKVTESHAGGASQVRIVFDVAPGGGGSGWTLEQATCSAPGYVPSPAQGSGIGSVVGNTLVILFSPALPNARTYRINLGPFITTIPGQSVEVRVLTGDATANGRVDAADRSAIVGVWTGIHFTCLTDITNNGATNAADRSAVVGAWTSPAANCAP